MRHRKEGKKLKFPLEVLGCVSHIPKVPKIFSGFYGSNVSCDQLQFEGLATNLLHNTLLDCILTQKRSFQVLFPPRNLQPPAKLKDGSLQSTAQMHSMSHLS